MLEQIMASSISFLVYACAVYVLVFFHCSMDNIDDERTPFMQEKLLPKKKRRYSFIWALWMSLSILFCLTLFGIMILMSTGKVSSNL